MKTNTNSANGSVTIVPRNPVARSPLLKKGGAHKSVLNPPRRDTKNAVKHQLEDWRDDLEFERSLRLKEDEL